MQVGDDDLVVACTTDFIDATKLDDSSSAVADMATPPHHHHHHHHRALAFDLNPPPDRLDASYEARRKYRDRTLVDFEDLIEADVPSEILVTCARGRDVAEVPASARAATGQRAAASCGAAHSGDFLVV